MSTCSEYLTPRPDTTVPTVLIRIDMSIRKSWLSTYSMSRANFSSHDRAFRPLIAARPVIP